MKKVFLSLIFGTALTVFLFQACRKESKGVLDMDTVSAEDNSTAESMFNDVFALMDEAATEQPGIRSGGYRASCATVTADTASSPRVLTLDFGSGCTGNDGRTRSGKIIITFTGRYRDAGTVISHTFDNFYINGNKVEGTKTVTNMGLNAEGNLVYKIEVKGAKITTDQGVLTWESTREREWTAGSNTPSILDDEYDITGTASGVNRKGSAYTIKIDDTAPVHVKVGCRWIVSGKVDIMPEGKSTRTVDYGFGTCDSQATVTINGQTYAFQMR
jgi:hypothetical protein